MPALVCVLLGLVPIAGCRQSGPCAEDPVGEVTVFLDGESGTSAFTGTLESIERPGEAGLRTYRFRDTENVARTLRFGAPGDSLPVAAGGRYSVRVETVPGMPTPNSVLIRDDVGFLFAAASDLGPGARVFQDPPEGFGISLEIATCGDRERNRCFESEINGRLVVARNADASRLYQSESAVVDGVRVTCLTARFLEYSAECADAGAFGVSYTMRRMDAAAP